MDIKPILTFNKPKRDGKRGKLQGGGEAPRTPSIQEQAVRIIPKVDSLEKRFAENILLADTPEGMQPEKVLVLEIAGDVQNLAEALSKVRGFEILSQSIVDREFRDENFFYVKKGEKKTVVKNAYLAMSNQAGLHRLLTMWRRFVESGSIDDGYAPLKQAFLQCVDIRFWDTRDRLESTYILEDWQYRVEDAAKGYDENIPFEM